MLDLSFLLDVPSLIIVFGASLLSPLILYLNVKSALRLCTRTILAIGCLGAQIGLIQAFEVMSSPELLPHISVIIVIPMLYAGIGYGLMSTFTDCQQAPVKPIPIFRKLASLAALFGIFLWAIVSGTMSYFFEPMALFFTLAFILIFGVIYKLKDGEIEFSKVTNNTLAMSIVFSSAGLLGFIFHYAHPENNRSFLAFSICLLMYGTLLYVTGEFFRAVTGEIRDTSSSFSWREFILVGLLSVVVPLMLVWGTI